MLGLARLGLEESVCRCRCSGRGEKKKSALPVPSLCLSLSLSSFQNILTASTARARASWASACSAAVKGFRLLFVV